MRSALCLTVFLRAIATVAPVQAASVRERAAAEVQLLTDLSIISTYWGQISTYQDNPDNYFGVSDTGLPDGCQVEQAHLLQRHAQRFPTSSGFTGPLAFLGSYQYIMGSSYLTGIGAATEVASGVQFWNKYGRTLYNASAGQVAYNASYTNGTARPKPLLRTTSQSRIANSAISWALGFFGTSYELTPDLSLANASADFNLVVIPEGGTENNTLASYDSCFNDDLPLPGSLGDYDLETYIPLYLSDATDRLQQYVPEGFVLDLNDTYAMQSICAYEVGYIGASDFCNLFTEEEWQGFENTLDIEYYYDYAWGNPTGRAQGLGWMQELLARLQNQYILVSNSSVNSTLDDNDESFTLGRPFYADFSHDDIIISVLTAMNMDYLRDPPSLTQVPPDANRTFILSHLTPFGARLITEVIGCTSANPTTQSTPRVQYYPTQYGYSPETATNKFIRIRLNSGILPLASIRGGFCEGRTDGMCSMTDFIDSQNGLERLANYAYACFGNYTVTNDPMGIDYDGTIFLGESIG